jgi:hypothetical protein
MFFKLKNKLKESIDSFLLQFLYGISITIPTSSNYGYRGVFFFIFSSCWVNFIMLLAPLIKLNILNEKNVFLWSTFLTILVFVLLMIKFKKFKIILDKTRAEKYYWIDFSLNKHGTYQTRIDIHKKYGKFGEYNDNKYISDKNIIKDFKKYNIKCRLIAVIYILITIFNFYLMHKFNL